MAASVRSARASDAAAVVQLTSQLGYDISPGEAEERLSRILSRAGQQFLVAEEDGHVVGWIHVALSEYVETGPFAVVGGLVVERERRKHGIGRLLLMHAEEWARGRGCSVIRLSSSAFRTNAHRFYENLGYVNIKTQHSFAKSLDAAGRDRLSALAPRTGE